jgi:L,D-transpeptidase YcbB
MIKSGHDPVYQRNHMRHIKFIHIALSIVLLFAAASCNFNSSRKTGNHSDKDLRGAINQQSNLPFDSSEVAIFFHAYPQLNKYQPDVLTVYRQHRFNQIWYDGKGVVEFGQTLYNKVKELKEEGVSSKFPYQEKVEGVFNNDIENTLSQTETDLMLTNLYLFYAEKVYKGFDDTTSVRLGWLLPRKQVSYTTLLDSVMANPDLITRDDSNMFSPVLQIA